MVCCKYSAQSSALKLANRASSSGAKVVATASKHNWPLLKSLGAEEVFDYNDPECSKKVRTSERTTLNSTDAPRSEPTPPTPSPSPSTASPKATLPKSARKPSQPKAARSPTSSRHSTLALMSRTNKRWATPLPARSSTSLASTFRRARRTLSTRRCFGR